MISGDLQKIIAEILPSADALDSPEFNPIDYINSMFPNEQSLIGTFYIYNLYSFHYHCQIQDF